ncbi:hypothetical protein GKE82_26550 [Conexibacter sp. W3-3-2]|uniref:hypothetical protein n=1 Tax=Conexibacter sp. W3-3-2 TaxID=2675227 RepID=UPI0012B76BD1|nr:hypothetical protein [Conexibacter sp. W3-3-2]MTD47761.1 hypothetical protein [Conexibacter sp. W3-3-2]
MALTPGSRFAAKLRDGGQLAPGQVVEPQGIDRVLGTFDRPTRAAFRELLIGFSASLQGRGTDLNSTVGSLAPTSEALRRLATTLAARDSELRALVHDSATTLRAVGARPAALGRLVRAGETALQATASQGRELTATVRALPGVLREARATLAQAQLAAGDAAPTLRALRPVAPLVQPALAQGAQLAPVVARVTQQIPPLASAARAGLPALTRLTDAAGPLLGTLRDAGRDLVPVLQTVDAYKDDLVSALATTAALAQGSVGGRHYLRPLFALFNESLVGYKQKLGSSRSNPYPAPGAYTKMFHGGLESLGARPPPTRRSCRSSAAVHRDAGNRVRGRCAGARRCCRRRCETRRRGGQVVASRWARNNAAMCPRATAHRLSSTTCETTGASIA